MGNYICIRSMDQHVLLELERLRAICKQHEREIEQLKSNLYTISLLLDFNTGLCKSIIEEPDGPPPELTNFKSMS